MSKDYDLLSFAESTNVKIGAAAEDMSVGLWRSLMDSSREGPWSEEDEADYREFADRQNWRVITEVIQTPSFWVLVSNNSEFLDLEF